MQASGRSQISIFLFLIAVGQVCLLCTYSTMMRLITKDGANEPSYDCVRVDVCGVRPESGAGMAVHGEGKGNDSDVAGRRLRTEKVGQ